MAPRRTPFLQNASRCAERGEASRGAMCGALAGIAWLVVAALLGAGTPSPARGAASSPAASDSASTATLQPPAANATKSAGGTVPRAPVARPAAPTRIAYPPNLAPFAFYTKNPAEPDGFGIEMLRNAAKQANVTCEFVAITEREMSTALRDGRASLALLRVAPNTKFEAAVLSAPLVETTTVVIVRAGDPRREETALGKLRIAIVSGSLEQQLLEERQLHPALMAADLAEAFRALTDELVDAVVCNSEAGSWVIQQDPRFRGRLQVWDTPLATTPVVLAGDVPNRFLADTFGEVISDLRADGLLEPVYWKWFARHSKEHQEREARLKASEERRKTAVIVAIALVMLLLAIGVIRSRSNRQQQLKLERTVKERTVELASSAQHYRALFDRARDAILLISPSDRRITEVNPASERLTGRNRSELVGRIVDELFASEDRARAVDFFTLQSASDIDAGSVLIDLTVQRPDGSRPIAQVRAAYVNMPEAPVLYLLLRDVTEAAIARTQLEKLNDNLRIQNALALAVQRNLPMGQRIGAGLSVVLELDEVILPPRGAIFLLDAQADTLQLIASRNIEGAVSLEDIELMPALDPSATGPLSPAKIPCSFSPLLHQASRGALRMTGPLQEDPLRQTPGGRTNAITALWAVPLRAEGRVNGVMLLYTRPGDHAADERRQKLLEALGSQLGLVLESELRQKRLSEGRHRLESLYEIAISLGSSLHLTEQLQVLFAQIRRVMPADAGNVWVADDEVFTGKAEVYYSYDTREDGSIVEATEKVKGSATAETKTWRVFTSGEHLLIHRTEDEIQALRATEKEAGAAHFGVDRFSRSLLYVPLKFKGRVIGVLTVQSYRAFAYTPETVEILMSLSAPLAAVIENARLFEVVEQRRHELDRSLKMIEADLKAAQVAQESLLPRDFPQVPGWDFGAVFIPSQYVGGDIYNVFRLDESHIGLFSIDVSGHGVPAALYSVGLNQYLMRDVLGPGILRAEDKGGKLRIRQPDEVITLLDRENMFKRHQRFFTMTYLVANTATGLVHYYRAGHNEPLLVRRGEGPRYLQGGGPLVGFSMPRNADELRTIQLEPGDRIILYSDGVNEASNSSGEEYGQGRLAQFFATCDGQRLQSCFDQLIQDIRSFSGREHFEDDVSMIGFSFNPKSSDPD